jgi:hypothetical protein
VIVVWPAVRALDLSDDPLPAQQDEVTVTETSENGRVTAETVTRERSLSWWDRTVGGTGVVLLGRIVLVTAAAFATGAIVQRLLLARFGFRAGGFELPEVAEEASAGVKELQAQIDLQDEVNVELQAQIDALQEMNDMQQVQIDDLRARIE